MSLATALTSGREPGMIARVFESEARTCTPIVMEELGPPEVLVLREVAGRGPDVSLVPPERR